MCHCRESEHNVGLAVSTCLYHVPMKQRDHLFAVVGSQGSHTQLLYLHLEPRCCQSSRWLQFDAGKTDMDTGD